MRALESAICCSSCYLKVPLLLGPDLLDRSICYAHGAPWVDPVVENRATNAEILSVLQKLQSAYELSVLDLELSEVERRAVVDEVVI